MTIKGSTFRAAAMAAALFSSTALAAAQNVTIGVWAGGSGPNDNYRVEEGHRLLTYLVPPSTPVTVLTREGDPASFGATSISVAELTELVAGKKPVELFEPLDSGVWARYRIDTVCALDQQYQP